jgi:Cys-tRNA(Pro)/Cys-tRNA(Cys) deacylase
MAKKKGGAGTPATVALTRAGVSYTEHAYEHDADGTRSLRRSRSDRSEGYGLEAAAALGLEPATVFKTLLAEVDGDLVVGIVPVTGQLDLKALAAAVGGKKATMADPAVAERATGYVVGGISPLGQKRRLRTVLDASADDHEVVYVSGGRRGLDLGLAPADLVRLTEATRAPISRS